MNHRNLIIVCVFGGLAASYLLFQAVSWLWIVYYMSFSPEPFVFFSRIRRLWSRIGMRFGHFRRGLHDPTQERIKSVYEPLDSVKSQIRLLKLLPGSSSQRVECASFTASLDEKELKYEALSYTWGSPRSPGTILLNKVPFPATENLEAALRCLRQPDESRILWVDAICINQLDLAERSQQVGLMRRIYSQASNVVIWLGSRCREGASAFLEGATEREDSAAWVQGTIGSPGYLQIWKELRRILSRNYWFRIWIIQEIVVASSIVVMCGGSILDWETVLLCDSVWKKCYKRRRLEHQEWFEALERIPTGKAARYFLNILPETWVNESQTMVGPAAIHESQLEIRSSASPSISFPELAFRHSKSKSSEPKDKIYALLGITRDPIMSGFVVDYSLSDSEAYEALVKHYCAKSHKLDILTYVNTNGNYLDRTRYLDKGRLASWIPDWRPSEAFAEARQHFTNLTRPFPFDAARGSSADISFEPASESTFNKPRMKVKGCILEEIETVWIVLDFDELETFPGTKYERAKQNISSCYFEALSAFKVHSKEHDKEVMTSHFTNSFWRALACNRNIDGTPAPDEWGLACEVLVFGESRLPQDFMANSPLSLAERAEKFTSPYLAAATQFMPNRRLCITRSGRLGVIPVCYTTQFLGVTWYSLYTEYSMARRYISIFLGCNYPMVIQTQSFLKNGGVFPLNINESGLRLQRWLQRRNWIANPWESTGAFDVVGCAYFDGYMEGQAMDEIASGKRQLEDIILG